MTKSNLTLIILGIALFGLYYLVSNLKSDFDRSEVLFGEKFLSEVQSIELSNDAKKTTIEKAKKEELLGLEKSIRPGQWLLTTPSVSVPNLESLNKFFSLISHLKILHTFETSSFSEFGLETPKNSLKLSTLSASKTLKLGNTNPVSKRRYAMLEGGKKVLLLDEASVSSLLKLELSELTPLKISPNQIKQVSIEGGVRKNFVRSDVGFKSEQEKNLDPQLIEVYLKDLLSSPAIHSARGTTVQAPEQRKLTLDWFDSSGTERHLELKFYPKEGGNILLTIPGSEVVYEYGPEMARLLDRKIETLFNKRLLSSITLDDFFGSCQELKFKEGCQVSTDRLRGIQEQIQRVEVLDLERLPGRLMTPTKPVCRLKLGSSKISFEIGATVTGDEALDSPRFFISDSGPDHYRGVISGLVAKEFCQAVEKLCNEAKAACAG